MGKILDQIRSPKDLKSLGKEELDALDGYETALLLIDEGNGVITPYGVLELYCDSSSRTAYWLPRIIYRRGR